MYYNSLTLSYEVINPIKDLYESYLENITNTLYFAVQKQGGSKARKNKGKDWINRGGSCRNKAKKKLRRKKKHGSR